MGWDNIERSIRLTHTLAILGVAFVLLLLVAGTGMVIFYLGHWLGAW